MNSQPESAKAVEQRKREHIQIPLSQDVSYKTKTTMFEDVILFHNALPEINRLDIDTSVKFLNHPIKAPIMITGMTGGAKEAAVINKNIARACQKLGIAMGLGSMKAMIVEPSLTYTYQVREVAPDILLAGNIGGNDLRHFSVEVLKKALKDVGADILAVHLNPAQELVQKEGQAEFADVLKTIADYSKKLPIYVKEVGQGLSPEVVKKLSQTNILALDVSGAGGTNWIDIEYKRRGLDFGPLSNWGIPTALAVHLASQNTKLPILASGGIRTGQDVIKALILGASIAGMAIPALKSGNQSYEAVEESLGNLIKEVGDIMFLLGARNLDEVKKIKPMIVGRLREVIASASEVI